MSGVCVFCNDVKGLLQQQLKNRCDFRIQLLRNCGFVLKKRVLFSSPSIIITVGPTASDPASSEDRLYSGASAIATVE